MSPAYRGRLNRISKPHAIRRVARAGRAWRRRPLRCPTASIGERFLRQERWHGTEADCLGGPEPSLWEVVLPRHAGDHQSAQTPRIGAPVRGRGRDFRADRRLPGPSWRINPASSWTLTGRGGRQLAQQRSPLGRLRLWLSGDRAHPWPGGRGAGGAGSFGRHRPHRINHFERGGRSLPGLFAGPWPGPSAVTLPGSWSRRRVHLTFPRPGWRQAREVWITARRADTPRLEEEASAGGHRLVHSK